MIGPFTFVSHLKVIWFRHYRKSLAYFFRRWSWLQNVHVISTCIKPLRRVPDFWNICQIAEYWKRQFVSGAPNIIWFNCFYFFLLGRIKTVRKRHRYRELIFSSRIRMNSSLFPTRISLLLPFYCFP